MAQDQSGLPDREQVDKMIGAILRAILDASPAVDEDKRFVRLDVPLNAMGYLIAAIGVQTKAVENRIATKAFVRQVADHIEGNIKMIRNSGDAPFGEQIEMFRDDQRH